MKDIQLQTDLIKQLIAISKEAVDLLDIFPDSIYKNALISIINFNKKRKR